MSANKRKGDTFERDVVAVLRAHGFPHAERVLRLGAHEDRGDVDGLVGFHVDCKNQKRHDFAGWLDACKREACDGVIPVVVVKRRLKPIADAYVVLELGAFADLIREDT
jgi:hypothetical protein